MSDMRTEKECVQTHHKDKDTKIYRRGKKDRNRITGEETDIESTMKKGGTMADADIPLEKWHRMFVFSTSSSHWF